MHVFVPYPLLLTWRWRSLRFHECTIRNTGSISSETETCANNTGNSCRSVTYTYYAHTIVLLLVLLLLLLYNANIMAVMMMMITIIIAIIITRARAYGYKGKIRSPPAAPGDVRYRGGGCHVRSEFTPVRPGHPVRRSAASANQHLTALFSIPFTRIIVRDFPGIVYTYSVFGF